MKSSFFEEVRIVLCKWQLIFFLSLFGREISILINKLVNEMLWPTTHNGKAICQTMPFKMSNLHYNWWEVGQILEAIINPPLEVPLLRYG
jgi:hypothetical protein